MNLRFGGGILIETPVAFVMPECSVKFKVAPAHLVGRILSVTCYFRHLAQVFKKAGIEVTLENKVEIDRVIHDIVGVNYKNCPAAWRQVKSRVLEDEANFVSILKDAWENRK